MTEQLHAFTSYLCQTWRGQTLVDELDDLSIDAARHVAKANTAFGYTVRLWAGNGKIDYTEVHAPDGTVRMGRFAETTLVKQQGSQP